MKKTAGIVAEFNPFHNGHAALCEAVREMGADRIVAVMSGNAVQRGEFAVTDKRVRARAALLSGVDLVLELPLPFAVATARTFAAGAVYLLRETGVIDALCFGSECGDIHMLRACARAVEDPAVNRLTGTFSADGVTYAKARQAAVEQLYGVELSECLSSPNNILAVEYLRQIKRLNWEVEAFTVSRREAGHDSLSPGEGIASASYLRTRPEELARYVPAQALEVYRHAEDAGLFPANPEALNTAMLAHLRRLTPEDLAALPDLSEGLEQRLYHCIRAAATVEKLEQSLKTKRYPLARIRRLILAAFLGLRQDDTAAPPPCIRVLGAGGRGTEILSAMKDSRLPVHTSLARLEELSPRCRRFAGLEATATDLYALSLPALISCGYEYTASAVFLK